MKLSKLSYAVGAACVTMMGTSAHALTAASFNPATTATFFWSGATAQDNGVLLFALKNCASGTLHRYTQTTNNYVLHCTVSGTSGLSLSKANMAIYKYSVGGSGVGVAPVNNGATLPFLDLTKLTAANCTTSTGAVATFPGFSGTNTNSASYVDVSCQTATTTVTTTGAVPRIGLSDVEPAFFSNETGNLNAEAVSALIFGVPVSTNVYRALQTAQGLATGYCTNQVSTVATGTVTATQQWEYLNECMPSLSRAQIVTAFTQGGTWAGIGLSSVSGPIYVARRVNSSGTQKTFEAIIARTPNGGGSDLKSCVTSSDPFLAADSGLESTETGDPATSCAGTAPPTVFAASGGGNVRTCLINHASAGRGAIGILTAEDVAPSGANSWRFVKVNGGSATNRGAAPTHADTASGNYTFWTVNSLNTISSFITGNSDYSALKTKFLADFDGNALKITQPFGASGVMADYGSLAVKPARDFTGATGINPWDKLVGGSAVDNCQLPKATQF